MQSMGIGGGFVMNLYVANEKRAYTLNARERAPLASATTTSWYSDPKSTMEGNVNKHILYYDLHRNLFGFRVQQF